MLINVLSIANGRRKGGQMSLKGVEVIKFLYSTIFLWYSYLGDCFTYRRPAVRKGLSVLKNLNNEE